MNDLSSGNETTFPLFAERRIEIARTTLIVGVREKFSFAEVLFVVGLVHSSLRSIFVH